MDSVFGVHFHHRFPMMESPAQPAMYRGRVREAGQSKFHLAFRMEICIEMCPPVGVYISLTSLPS